MEENLSSFKSIRLERVPQSCEDGKGGDAAALQVGAAAEIQGLQLGQAGQRG